MNHPAFPEVALKSVERINLHRQTAGGRGPGHVVLSALPGTTDPDELLELCQGIGPGRFKAFALDARGKALGPAWTCEIAEPDAPPAAPTPAAAAAQQTDALLERLRASTDDRERALDDLRDRLTTAHERDVARLRDEHERHLTLVHQQCELTLSARLSEAAAQHARQLAVAEDQLRAANEERERAVRRADRLVEELADCQRRLTERTERLQELQQATFEEQLRLRGRVAELEAELRANARAHDAELREAKAGNPDVQAMVVRKQTEWDIDRQRELLRLEIDERARASSFFAQAREALKDERVQEFVLPLLNELITSIAQRGQAQPAG